jgi:polysaccharide biosynthesis/export protein
VPIFWLVLGMLAIGSTAMGQVPVPARPVDDSTIPELAGGEPEARPGDRVILKIWNEPEMSDTFTVAQNGHVILPRLGSTPVEGIPIELLQDSIRAAYAEFLLNPSVEIVVRRRLSVLGEVAEPGIYWADLTMGLPDVIALAGGPTEAADPNRISILRGSERFEFRRQDQRQMFAAELHSGDQITVRPKNFLVRNPWAAVSTVFTMITLIRQLGF